MKTTVLPVLVAFWVLGCAGPTAPDGITKQEARKNAKADWPEDHCGTSEWYGDGECDDFCPSPDPDCQGGSGGCGGEEGCPPGEVCDLHACQENASGRCVDPQDCNAGSGPVCGCDGRTYPDDCQRLAAGVAARHLGDCRPETCGGIPGQACPTGKTCVLESCRPQATGRCQPLPVTCPDTGDPSCGCDGRTYPNDCLRRMAGVARAPAGNCPY